MSNLINSSIGKKLMMALAGLFLCVFMVIHLTINLFMLLPDDGALFSEAVEFMGNPVMKILEIVLFGGFALHMIYGFVTIIKNRIARPVGYAVANNKQTSFFSKYMTHTGIIIALFLVLHFINFYFVKLGIVPIPEAANGNSHDFYSMAIALFSNPFYTWLYVAIMVILGFHLNHAFQSAFQTMGWNHPLYTPIIKWVGTIYSIVIAVGFSIIPLYFLYFYNC